MAVEKKSKQLLENLDRQEQIRLAKDGGIDLGAI